MLKYKGFIALDYMVYRTDYYSKITERAVSLVEGLDHSLLYYLHYNDPSLKKTDLNPLIEAADLEAGNSEIRGHISECLENRVKSEKPSRLKRENTMKDKRFVDSLNLFKQIYFRDCNDVKNRLIESFNKYISLRSIQPNLAKNYIPYFSIKFNDDSLILQSTGREHDNIAPIYFPNEDTSCRLFYSIEVYKAFWGTGKIVAKEFWKYDNGDELFTWSGKRHLSEYTFNKEAKRVYSAYFDHNIDYLTNNIKEFLQWFTNFRNIPQRLTECCLNLK